MSIAIPSWGKSSKLIVWNLLKSHKDWIPCFIPQIQLWSIIWSRLRDKHQNRKRRLATTSMLRLMILSRSRWIASCSRPTLRWRFKTWIIRFMKQLKLSIQWRPRENSTWVSQKTLSFSLTSGWHLNLEVCYFYKGTFANNIRLKAAFSRKGLWNYTLLRFFIIFSSQFFDRACDLLRVEIWIQIQSITSSVKRFRRKIDEKLDKCIFSKTFSR